MSILAKIFGRKKREENHDYYFDLETCPLTELSIVDEEVYVHTVANEDNNSFTITCVSYLVDYKDFRCQIILCKKLYYMLTWDSEFESHLEDDILENIGGEIEQLEEYLSIILYGLSKSDYKQLFGKVIHWNCDLSDDKGLFDIENLNYHLLLKPYAKLVKQDDLYPKNKEDKLKLILEEIDNKTSIGLGDLFEMDGLQYFGKFGMKNNAELQKQLDYLEGYGLLERRDDTSFKLIELPSRIKEKIFSTMTNNNNNSINGNNNTVIQNLGDNANLNLTQNIGNTFSQENKNDIKEIIQFLKENVENLNLSNDDATDIQDDIQVLESQIIRENPKKDRIKNTLQSIVTSITANVLSPNTNLTDIINKAKALIENIGY